MLECTTRGTVKRVSQDRRSFELSVLPFSLRSAGSKNPLETLNIKAMYRYFLNSLCIENTDICVVQG